MNSLKLAIFIFVTTMVGCASPYQTLRESNRSALMRIDAGMTRSQVQQIMGEKSATGISGKVENPYKRETALGGDGVAYEILYYYTEQVGERPVETGLTPIVFRDGKVVGIGWGYLDSIVGNNTTTIRRR